MQVILLEQVRNLGSLGDTVRVKAGYGRNYLIPQGKAASATKDNLAKFESRRAELEKRAVDRLGGAEQRAVKLNELSLEISALASEEGKLYGSVGVNEITDAIKKAGFEIDKREVSMPEGAIHELGDFTITLQLHSDVTATVSVKVIDAKA